MQTTAQLLEAVKARYGVSDWKLAPLLDVVPSAVKNWKAGRNLPDDKTAVKVADLLGIEPHYVLACIHAERAASKGDDQMAAVWEILAGKVLAAEEKVQRAGKRAAAVLLAVAMSFFIGGGPDAGAHAPEVGAPSPTASAAGPLCIM